MEIALKTLHLIEAVLSFADILFLGAAHNQGEIYSDIFGSPPMRTQGFENVSYVIKTLDKVR